MPLFSIIIPTYNEAKNLPLLLEEIFFVIGKNKDKVEIIIVDDNSPDGTGDVAEGLKSTYPLKVIHRSGKLGLGSAVKEGFELSTSKFVGVMDADLSHDPTVLNSMFDELERGSCDIIIGSRFQGGSEVENWKWWRRFISEVGVRLTHFLTGVKDPLSGYFFFKKSVIEGVLLDTVGYKILFEILIKGKYEKIKEIPFKFRIRKYSSSKLNWREHWMFFGQLIKYSWYKLARRFLWKK